MQKADLILLNGATYDKWLAGVSLPESKLIDTSSAFADQYIKTVEAGTHSHGKGGDHSHAGTAFTTWIDFDQALQQARAVKDALTEIRPAQPKLSPPTSPPSKTISRTSTPP